MAIASSTKSKEAMISVADVSRLFTVATELTNVIEDILEDTGYYHPEFLRGVAISRQQARAGKQRVITSLAELN